MTITYVRSTAIDDDEVDDGNDKAAPPPSRSHSALLPVSAMASLCVSAPLKPSSLLSPSSFFLSPNALLSPRSRSLLSISPPPRSPIRALVSSASPASKPFSHGSLEPQSYFSSPMSSPFDSFSPASSDPQTPTTARRGAESDVMGLLLRERIVFLGSSIDDFVADAIISQLLLLDAQDHTKDIRLFVNSSGGSLRYTRGTRSA
ncbi:hypothetical protein B296_00046798 [Ensete ventricosum]|uniref:ATP-dependent Clp protease proteolytic subunit n=1 Tax=Ensete ventricosum TaxID=4639 RepID=A0A426X9Z9_ENSVE|nr:hypothetical protein B296_00046798 [Ensete ventricosum]